jgi:hypothetical protein
MATAETELEMDDISDFGGNNRRRRRERTTTAIRQQLDTRPMTRRRMNTDRDVTYAMSLSAGSGTVVSDCCCAADVILVSSASLTLLPTMPSDVDMLLCGGVSYVYRSSYSQQMQQSGYDQTVL